jgi:pimeloyl-ACP methyl ester carboxylesterase
VNATDQPSRSAGAKPTVVLVHGAFADGSSWNGVIERLQQQGYPVIAPANPLRGVAADSAYTASLVSQIDGPVLLAGHSYGGAVIRTGTGASSRSSSGTPPHRNGTSLTRISTGARRPSATPTMSVS